MPDTKTLLSDLVNTVPFVHVVLFRLPKDAHPGEAEELVDDIYAQLQGLPTVEGLWTGTPAGALTPLRPMVDMRYDVGLMALFRNQQGLDEYLAHPIHEQFAEKWDLRCDVRVFDFAR